MRINNLAIPVNYRHLRNLLWSCLLILILPIKSFSQDQEPYVLMISFDAFRYDYVEKYNLHNFQDFIREGVAAEYLIPSYPSKTFPNHYTLVTGLYPGHHGLVDNTFYDPERKKLYTKKDTSMIRDPENYGGTPLWQLASEQGVKSAAYFWIGSEAPIKGKFPDFYLHYDKSIPNEERIQTVMKWLSLPPAERPHLITLYFSLVDDSGHDFGPCSKGNKKVLHKADDLLGEIVKDIDQSGLPVNIIVVSDHGMYEMHNNPETYIPINEIVRSDSGRVIVINNETHVHVYVNDTSKIDSIYQRAQNHEEHYTTYLRKDIPALWHYSDNPRVGDLLLVADPGFSFDPPDKRKTYGTHGFNPYGNMQIAGIFYARGPLLKKGLKIPPFKNIHIYPLIATLLGLEIPPIDGDVSVLKNIISNKDNSR